MKAETRPRKPHPKSAQKTSGKAGLAMDLLPLKDLAATRDPEFRTYYANNARVMSTFYEISLLLGEIGFGPDGKPSINDKCRIVMNPAHAKALAYAIATNVHGWEQKFGPIRFPPGMVPPDLVGDEPTPASKKPEK